MNCVKRRIAPDILESSLNWLCPALYRVPTSRTGAASYIRLSTAVSYQHYQNAKRRKEAAKNACRPTKESTKAALDKGRQFGTVSGGDAGGGILAQQLQLFNLSGKDREELRELFGQYAPYERVQPDENTMTCAYVKSHFSTMLKPEGIVDELVTVYGRVWSIRKAGSKLWFVDIMQNGTTLQCVFNRANMNLKDENLFQPLLKFFGRGDVIRVEGRPHRTSRGEVSLLVAAIPGTMALCLHQLPEKIANDETNIRNRHLDLLINPEVSRKIRLRSTILSFLREFLSNRGFVDVQTPILSSSAGGAVARPFFTSATEFPERNLALRISPELWLKRLIVGGMDQVYEIGPSFRNEGIDMTHNPEFWTCEFYKTYASIDELMSMTEQMLYQLSMRLREDIKIPFTPPFRRLDFVTTVEEASGLTLPRLTDPDADAKLIQRMEDKRIPIPSNPTLPRLLDKLCSEYVESLCDVPTWIVKPPECVSPLAKSFQHDTREQRVAARAELFVNHQELVNTYEEENNPHVQRRKFEAQRRYNRAEDIDDEGSIDESYLQALEWGMPPTGGWGCGIERLCMLFSGTRRISDTLSFGTLRNVVSSANVPPSTKQRRTGREEAEFLTRLCGKAGIFVKAQHDKAMGGSSDSDETVCPNDFDDDQTLSANGDEAEDVGRGKGHSSLDDWKRTKSRLEEMLARIESVAKARESGK